MVWTRSLQYIEQALKPERMYVSHILEKESCITCIFDRPIRKSFVSRRQVNDEHLPWVCLKFIPSADRVINSWVLIEWHSFIGASLVPHQVFQIWMRGGHRNFRLGGAQSREASWSWLVRISLFTAAKCTASTFIGWLSNPGSIDESVHEYIQQYQEVLFSARMESFIKNSSLEMKERKGN